MQTIDIHTHLLSSEVKFDRLYDRLALGLFGKRMGMDPKAMATDPYDSYVDAVISNVKASKHIQKLVLFGVDVRVDEKGSIQHKDTTVCASNESLLAVYEKHPDVIIPFFSINPKRPDALDLIDKYAALGFKGAKFLQNYWGVDTREPRYKAYFEKLASLGIPLIVHIGSESSIHSYKECESIEMLNAPLGAGVKTIAAHMALSYNPWHPLKSISKNPKNFNEEYFQLLAMLEQHNDLYADISALLTPARAKVLRHLSEQTQIHEKLLYGTDFPVPFTTIWNSYDLPFKRRKELSKEKNPFDRYAKTMLEYFDENNPLYSNYQKILNNLKDYT